MHYVIIKAVRLLTAWYIIQLSESRTFPRAGARAKLGGEPPQYRAINFNVSQSILINN